MNITTYLPNELLGEIISFLDKRQLLFFKLSCRSFYEVLNYLNITVNGLPSKCIFSDVKYLTWCSSTKYKTYEFEEAYHYGLKYGDCDVLDCIYRRYHQVHLFKPKFYKWVLKGNAKIKIEKKIQKLSWLKNKRCPYDFDLICIPIPETLFSWLSTNFVWSEQDFGKFLDKSTNLPKDIMWVIKSVPFLSQFVCDAVAYLNDMEALEWAYMNNFQCSMFTCSIAAKKGNLEMLKFLRSKNIQWNEWTITDAAANGQLHVIKWARENGCKWNGWACVDAVLNGHLDILKWLVENGCPISSADLTAACDEVSMKYPEIQRWLIEQSLYVFREYDDDYDYV